MKSGDSTYRSRLQLKSGNAFDDNYNTSPAWPHLGLGMRCFNPAEIQRDETCSQTCRNRGRNFCFSTTVLRAMMIWSYVRATLQLASF